MSLNVYIFNILGLDSVGAGVPKSFLVKCFTGYMKKNFNFPRHNFSEEPSLAVTASTKAVTNVNGATLHSPF